MLAHGSRMSATVDGKCRRLTLYSKKCVNLFRLLVQIRYTTVRATGDSLQLRIFYSARLY